ncbi:selenium metabolism-associated LysR family transcriptional regulator [Dissulfurispira thermophila]|uniref:selenium metabolism-associated LysR family transcriptional regulator n=1 Tax=Dissulfurispira thermophila TaxID=2715679 RepID=UPI00193E4342|nr:selenium metabolism-associated LysR family transcriptional regulator [Dissulfurispira thermophila]
MVYKFKIFCTIAETGSFSKTSKIVHITQPAVSLQIQALEEICGTKLLDRSRGSVTLTTAGEVLYKYAKKILDLHEKIEKEIGKATGMIKGGVTFGASTTLGNHVLPNVIINFRKKHPKIKINMLVGNAKRIEDLLNTGFIDFGIIAGEPSKTWFKAEPILQDELGFIIPIVHPWSRKELISILEITKEPFIMREAGSATRQKIEEYLLSHGIGINKLHIALVLGSTESIKEAVIRGAGVSIISKWDVKEEVKTGKLKFVSPKEEKIFRNFSLIMPTNTVLSPSAEELISYLKNYPYATLL